MTAVRPAQAGDAGAIGAIHVAAWRSAYATILPEAFLAGLSARTQAEYYRAGIVARHPTFVAEIGGRVVGFATASRARSGPADGEVETLYVLDDWRDQGAGRALMAHAAAALAAGGCRHLFLWVLRDNPSRWFYRRLGGRHAADGQTTVAGTRIAKSAYVWDPITLLLPTPAPS